MLFSVDTASKTATPLTVATFAALELKERFDIQEWVLRTPSLLGEELLVVSTEFDRFDRTSERLDVLAVDRRGKLVVVELKRTAVGTAAELQALRYAAFCSTFSLEDVAELFVRHLAARGEPGVSSGEARERIIDYVGDPSFQALDDKPRVILAAQEFPHEITATVLWLRSFEVDLRCVRLTPYMVGTQLVVDSSVLIPLPETEAFLVRRERKEVEQAGSVVKAPSTAEEFLTKTMPLMQPIARQLRDWLTARPGATERVYKTLMSYRVAADRSWISWMELTKTEVRVGLPPGTETGDLVVVRSTSTGWNLVSVRTPEEIGFVKEAMELAGPTEFPPGSYVSNDWSDFYVSVGEGPTRTWEDCVRYGFVSAGNGTWYSNTLKQLSPGHRVFACIPKTGYVGVGIVRESVVPVRQFTVELDGAPRPLLEVPLKAARMGENADDPELSEYVVRVDWVRTLPERDAIWEKGMFANQNTVCRLTQPFTRDMLLERFGLGD